DDDRRRRRVGLDVDFALALEPLRPPRSHRLSRELDDLLVERRIAGRPLERSLVGDDELRPRTGPSNDGGERDRLAALDRTGYELQRPQRVHAGRHEITNLTNLTNPEAIRVIREIRVT